MREFKTYAGEKNTNTGILSLRHGLAITWNTLPQSVKGIEDHRRFKSKLHSFSATVETISFNDSALFSNKELSNFRYF